MLSSWVSGEVGVEFSPAEHASSGVKRVGLGREAMTRLTLRQVHLLQAIGFIMRGAEQNAHQKKVRNPEEGAEARRIRLGCREKVCFKFYFRLPFHSFAFFCLVCGWCALQQLPLARACVHVCLCAWVSLLIYASQCAYCSVPARRPRPESERSLPYFVKEKRE